MHYTSLLFGENCSKKDPVFQVQKFEHGRNLNKKFIERYQDSNEDYNLVGDQMEKRFEESERKPTMKRIVRHKIENNEVKHPSSSNEIDKIFSKDYMKLFKNESSDGSQQNPSESERVQISETIREGKEQSNLIQNYHNDSSIFINRNSETEHKETSSVNDAGRITEQKENGMSPSVSGGNLQKIFATDKSEHNINQADGEVISESTPLSNDAHAMDMDTEEYAIGNEFMDYNDDYAHLNSHVYNNDYYENKEYGINYDEQDRDYSNHIENIQYDDRLREYGTNYDEQQETIDYSNQNGNIQYDDRLVEYGINYEEEDFNNQREKLQSDKIHNDTMDTPNDKLENGKENTKNNGSLMISQEESLQNEEVTLQNTLRENSANNAVGDEVIDYDYSGDYFRANDDLIDYDNNEYVGDYFDEQDGDAHNPFEHYNDFYDNKEYSNSQYEEYRELSNQMENYGVYDGKFDYYDVYDDYFKNMEYLMHYDEQYSARDNSDQMNEYDFSDDYLDYSIDNDDNYYFPVDALDYKSQNDGDNKDVSVQVKVQI